MLCCHAGSQDVGSLTAENKQLRDYVRKLESDRKHQLDLWQEAGRGGGAGGKQVCPHALQPLRIVSLAFMQTQQQLSLIPCQPGPCACLSELLIAAGHSLEGNDRMQAQILIRYCCCFAGFQAGKWWDWANSPSDCYHSCLLPGILHPQVMQSHQLRGCDCDNQCRGLWSAIWLVPYALL